MSVNHSSNGTCRKLGSAALLMLILVMVGCSSKGVVVTQDDSAEYRDARELPPLKKPERDSRVIVSGPAQDVQSGEAVAPVTAPAVTPAPPAAITARVVDAGDDAARLQIDAGFERAWDFLSNGLKSSDLTVHSRNQVAGRFAIGCASMELETTVAKSGGWSIFRRKPAQTSQHCAMQVVSKRKSSTVSILDRSGEEISADVARQVFARLLNN